MSFEESVGIVIKETKTTLTVRYEDGTEKDIEREFVRPTKIKIYKHLFNTSLLKGLKILIDGKPTKIGAKDLLNHGSYGNISKLRQWDLIQEVYHEDKKGKKMGGVYKITDRGLEFLKGNIKIPDAIFFGGNELYSFSERKISVHEIKKEKMYKEQKHIGDYQEQTSSV